MITLLLKQAHLNIKQIQFLMKTLMHEINAKYGLFNDCLNFKSKIYVNQNLFQQEDRPEKETVFHFKVSKHYFPNPTLW